MIEFVQIVSKICICLLGICFFLKTRKSVSRRTKPLWQMVYFGQKKYKRWKEIEIVVKGVELDENGTTCLVADIPCMKKYVVLYNAFASEIKCNAIAVEQILTAYLYKVEGETYVLDSMPPVQCEADIVASAQKEKALQSKISSIRSCGRLWILLGAYLTFLSPEIGILVIGISVWLVRNNIPFAERKYWVQACRFESRPVHSNRDEIVLTDVPEDYNEWSRVKKYLFEFDKRYCVTPVSSSDKKDELSEVKASQVEQRDRESCSLKEKREKPLVRLNEESKTPPHQSSEQLSFFSNAYVEPDANMEQPMCTEEHEMHPDDIIQTSKDECDECQQPKEMCEAGNLKITDGEGHQEEETNNQLSSEGDEKASKDEDASAMNNSQTSSADQVSVQNGFSRSFQKRKYKKSNSKSKSANSANESKSSCL